MTCSKSKLKNEFKPEAKQMNLLKRKIKMLNLKKQKQKQKLFTAKTPSSTFCNCDSTL